MDRGRDASPADRLAADVRIRWLQLKLESSKNSRIHDGDAVGLSAIEIASPETSHHPSLRSVGLTLNSVGLTLNSAFRSTFIYFKIQSENVLEDMREGTSGKKRILEGHSSGR